MAYAFSDRDIAQIESHGLTEARVQEQLQRFKMGFPKAYVTAPAMAGTNILHLSDEELMITHVNRYGAYRGSRVKFVPASGAATRLFKGLHEWLRHPDPQVDPLGVPLKFYPFGPALRALLISKGENPNMMTDGRRRTTVLRLLLESQGLGMADKPKALIPFHKYSEQDVRTALEEHLVEGALYCKEPDGKVNLHFTISPHHIEQVKRFYMQVKNRYESQYGVKYRAQWSVQDSSTDTIAVNPDLTPYRDAAGRLVFRPAGHGALLLNLQSIEQELIFIKNIDNVAPDRLKPESMRYKEALAGLLLTLRDTVFGYLRQLDEGDCSEAQCDEMLEFCRRELFVRLATGAKEMALDRKKAYLRGVLNRPIRVCGMVPNEGAPGGGPFWVRERNGAESLQIVESSQMDMNDPSIEGIVQQAKFFNPVDIVCSIRDYKGERFNLTDFVDANTGFISEKSIGSDPILAMELPGLWNGGMAHWNTIFVQVPSLSFTPVKTYLDLISPVHQTRYSEEEFSAARGDEKA